MLADHQIRYEIDNGGDILVSPFNPKAIQPASMDLRLGSTFIRCVQGDVPIDPMKPDPSHWVRFDIEDKFVIRPGEFVLATTLEWIGIGSGLRAQVDGKSTLGRSGLTIHKTAGFIDPGFKGNITLEMTNDNVRPIILRPSMWICQISFYRMDERVRIPYGDDRLGSHYNNQNGTTLAAPMR